MRDTVFQKHCNVFACREGEYDNGFPRSVVQRQSLPFQSFRFFQLKYLRMCGHQGSCLARNLLSLFLIEIHSETRIGFVWKNGNGTGAVVEFDDSLSNSKFLPKRISISFLLEAKHI